MPSSAARKREKTSPALKTVKPKSLPKSRRKSGIQHEVDVFEPTLYKQRGLSKSSPKPYPAYRKRRKPRPRRINKQQNA